MTTEDFRVAARKALDDMKGGPESWTFLGFKRTESGAFRDEDIVKVLLEATDNVASAFKARAIPEVMRAIDLLGMEAARKTPRCCTTNEFREFIGLKKYSSFEEWNPDKDVARAAEKLYKHVDHLDMYPGLTAEGPQPSMDGSGLAPGEELFEDDPAEYVRRDLDSASSETRRQAASDFTKALMEQFETQVTQIVTQYIGAYMEQYAASPQANWKSKDTAIFLVTSIATRGSIQQQGVTSTNALVDVTKFFSDHILADLQAAPGSVHPVVQADAIKFLFTFRMQLTKEQLLSVLPLLIPHLENPSFVIHTYAALTFERILFIKTNNAFMPYTFKVPEKLPGCSKCLFFWSWFNKTGNREMYQNAAVVSISGTSTSFTGPQAFRMNTFGDGVCSLLAEEPVVFPAPGEQVFYGSGFDASSASNAPDCPDWDNNKEVTVTGSGDGPSDAKPSGGAAEGSAGSSSSAVSAPGSAAAGATGDKSDDAKSTSSGGAAAASTTGTGSGGTSSGAAGAAQTGGAGAAGAAAGEGGAGTTGSSGAGSGSSSSSSGGSSDSSSSSNDKEFLVFAGGAVALVVVAGVVIFLAHRNLSAASVTAGRARRRSHSWRASSSDSSDSSVDDRRRRGGRSRRGRRRYGDEEKDSSSSDD
ncbi:hypothetical protein JCM8208_007493 [Rhodotorula glutinis]